jgi:hypothetical protein
MKINIVEKENKFWAETKKKVPTDQDFATFKSWNVVRSIPIYNPNEFPQQYSAEVTALLSEREDLERWDVALVEPFLGHTEESYEEVFTKINIGDKTLNCTPWTLKTAHHLLTFEKITGHSIHEYEQIVDFGAGIGEMGRMLRDLGFQGDYYILDLPEVASISSRYLTELNKKHKVATNYSEIPNDKKTLFIATWSLSEVPFAYRNEIASYFKKQDFLIIFQQQVFEYQNTGYFVAEFPRRSETYIQLHQIQWHGGGGGNFYLFTKS